jgi:NAD(P)-dependent dehydrogenase (short-subunit alcohol dehydrogenase family)
MANDTAQASGSGLLAGKTIVITGVGTGLGKEVATIVARDGANLVIGARTESQLAEVAAELDPSGERVAYVATDISDQESCDRIVATAIEKFGKLDGIAQIAAYEGAMGGLADASMNKIRKSMDTNLIGSLQMVKAAAPALKANGGGSVVLIGSQSMYLPLIDQIGYAASKGALLTAMFHLAKEFGPDKIRVNTVVPSWMWGPPVQMYVDWQASTRGVEGDVVKAEIEAGIPLGEIVADEDVADAVSFFLSDRARMITGQSLMVNGGELMR